MVEEYRHSIRDLLARPATALRGVHGTRKSYSTDEWNTYTGPTTVTGGVLIILGDFTTSSSISIASGATQGIHCVI